MRQELRHGPAHKHHTACSEQCRELLKRNLQQYARKYDYNVTR